MNLIRRRLAALACVLLMMAPTVTLAATAPVTVFAAASLKNALDEVTAAWRAKTGSTAVASYGASSALARQIESGAQADVFISADSGWMDDVAKKGLIAADTRRDVLTNHLALVAPAHSAVKLRIGKGMPLAKALGDGRLAVAGPTVPAGIYAKASLETLGVWDTVAGKLAPADNVRGALMFVTRGETPLGIVYDTDARVEPGVRIVGLFPDDSHPPIVYPAAVTARSANPDARAFLAFLQGPQAAAIFRRYGFILLRGGGR